MICFSFFTATGFLFCFLQKNDRELVFTWSVRKLVLVDGNDPVIRNEDNKCIELTCSFVHSMLVSANVSTELRLENSPFFPFVFLLFFI